MMEIICYACGKGEYPENSMEAIENCQRLNKNWYVEMDLQLTKDKQVILFHDQDLMRLAANRSLVKECDLDTVRTIVNKSNNNKDYNGFSKPTVPTLQEVFIRYPSIRAVIDIKSNNLEIVDKILEVIDSYTNKADIVVVSIHKKIIKEFKKQRPNLFYGAPKYKVQQILYSNCLGLLDAVTFKYDILMMPYTYHNIRVLKKKFLNISIKKTGQFGVG